MSTENTLHQASFVILSRLQSGTENVVRLDVALAAVAAANARWESALGSDALGDLPSLPVPIVKGDYTVGDMRDYARAAVAKERERCAAIAESWATDETATTCANISAAIRGA